MNNFSDENKYNVKESGSEEWFEVHSGAITNTNPN